MENCANCKHHDVFWSGGGCNLLNGGERCKYEPNDETVIRELREKLSRYEKAEREGRIKVLPESKCGTCGSCGHFHRIAGTRRGTCDVKDRYTDRYGKPDDHRGRFEPSQSKKACKKYTPTESALKEAK